MAKVKGSSVKRHPTLEPLHQVLPEQDRMSAQQETIRRLSNAVDQSFSAVMITDLESRIQYANTGLCNQIGYSKEDLIGRSWRDFQQVETPPEKLADLVATVRAGRSWRNEWYNRRKNGELYLVRGSVSPVLDDNGKLAAFVAIFEDMTEIKRNDATRGEALERAVEDDRAKSRFLAIMGRELRTPLNCIEGFTSLLRDTTLTAEQREYAEIIRTSSKALIELTKDILDLAQMEGGKLKIEPEFCDPRQCLDNVLDLMAARAADKGLKLLRQVDEDVPPIVVADEMRLAQVLGCLIGNAVKFTCKGEVEVTLGLERTPQAAPGECRLVFAVRDTGIGIATGDFGKLFKPFSQVIESGPRRYGGTGIGLALSKHLIELMGGQSRIESTPDRGSTFSFSVPVAVESFVLRTTPELGRMQSLQHSG